MTCTRFVYRGLLLAVLVSLCCLTAVGDNSTCGAAPTCSASCSGASCAIELNRSQNTLTLSYGGSDATVLCVPYGSSISWTPSNTSSAAIVGVLFNGSSSPGNSSVLSGNNKAGATTTASNTGCFVYSIELCDFSGSCAVIDPKVVIGGGPLEKKHPKKKKDSY